jgi:hypothetical protein
VATRKNHALSYPAKQAGIDGERTQSLIPHSNNVGDPCVEGNVILNSTLLVRAVLDLHARPFHTAQMEWTLRCERLAADAHLLVDDRSQPDASPRPHCQRLAHPQLLPPCRVWRVRSPMPLTGSGWLHCPRLP